MKKFIEFRFGCALLSAFLLSFPALAGGEGPIPEAEEVEGSLAGITMGRHWAGPELKGPESLRGKVVLLKIWGG